jgi:hypothetical protein
MNLFTKILLGIVFGLFALWYFTNQSRIKNKTELATCKLSELKKDSLIQNQKLNYWALYESKQKTETITIIKKGAVQIVYKEIPVIMKDSTKTLIDSLKNDDIQIKWIVEYIGEIFSFKPTWNITQKTIIKENIVKVPTPYPVEKLVPINKRMVYIGGSLAIMDKAYLFIDITYLDKKRIMYKASFDPFNRIYMAGAGYRLFSF